MASILPNGRVQFIDQNGKPLVGGSVTFYEPGTTTKKDTYQDSAMTEPNTNPVVLDSRGQATIWGSGTYRQIVQDVFGVTIWDQVVSSSASSDDLAGTDGAGMIGLPDGTTLAQAVKSGLNKNVTSIAMLRTLSSLIFTMAFATGYYGSHDGGGGPYQLDPNDTSSLDNGGTVIVANDGGRWKLQLIDTVSIMQFGARRGEVADGIDVGDNTARIQACLNCGLAIWEVPEGRFVHSDLVIPQVTNHVLFGSGPASTFVQTGGGLHYPSMEENCFNSHGTIRNLNFDGTAGTANTLDTTYCQTLDILDVSFNNTPATLSSLKLDGNPTSSTYAHDVRVMNIRIYSTTAGNAGIALGAWHSDSSIDNFQMDGQFQVNYCLFAEINAQTTYVSNSHPYNAKINVVRLDGNNTHFRWTNVTFDNALQHTFYQLNSVNGQFSNCYFQSTNVGWCAVILDHSFNNNFTNIKFESPFGVANTCFQELNGSDGNKLVVWQIDDPAHWTALVNLTGSNSIAKGCEFYGKFDAVYTLPGVARAAQAPNTALDYGANGGVGGLTNEGWCTPLDGFIRRLVVFFDNPPASGQTFTFNLRKNGVAVAGAIVPAGQFGVTIEPSPPTAVLAGDQISVQSVFSPGANSASPRYSVVLIG
ncbi:hypothetical protein [Burkholderia gladioli]|uniref:hypothetical protein n=1 Tax=Burkholderia gladioli TaxID=28095 RepID=UPI0016418413|nr:hypothetical protein [Burkholderia gladioli]